MKPLRFDRAALPPQSAFSSYLKIVPTQATRIDGEFYVVTSEGTLYCPDGYLAIDSRGYPYPIAVEEFERIYVQQLT